MIKIIIFLSLIALNVSAQTVNQKPIVFFK